MSSLEDLEDLEQSREQDQDDKDKKEKKDNKDGTRDADKDGDAEMKDLEDEKKEDDIDPEILNGPTQDIVNRRRLLENDVRVMRQEYQRLTHERTNMGKRIEENLEKIENNR